MDLFVVPALALGMGFAAGGALGWWIAGLKARVRAADLDAQRRADADKIAWLQLAHDQLREAFQALAAQTLRDEAGDFSGRLHHHLQSHAGQIGALTQTLERNLGALDGNLRLVEQQRQGAYQALVQQIVHLDQAQRALQQTTDQLAATLKAGPVRGRWGEIQLRKIVELAGMAEHVSFAEQMAGNSGGRPDLVIRLPQAGHIPVDAKFALEAFVAAMETVDASKRRDKLNLHVQALKDQIKDLSRKAYWKEFPPAPELTILFVPVESCLQAVYEHDPGLLEFALERKILLATPLSLMGFLKAIAYGWQQFTINKNARQIVEQGKQLQERIETWLTHFRKVGERLAATVLGYNDATASLQSRFLPACRRFQDLTALAEELPEVEALGADVNLPLAPQRTAKRRPKG